MDSVPSNASGTGASNGEHASPEKDKAGQPGHKTSVLTAVAAAVWLVTVVAAMGWMVNYSNAPGRAAAAPPHWPAESRIPLAHDRPTLVMFAHPHCPCTRASLGELELLLARCAGQVEVHVLFIKPAGTEADWTQTDLWRHASAIPGVAVSCDEQGVESRRFHSETSGQTMLYDPDGTLRFEGGITLSRGHSGDNPGRSAIVALLEHKGSSQARTPVFGCSLFNVECDAEGIECKH